MSIRIYVRDGIVDREYLEGQRGIDRFGLTRGVVEHEGLTLLLDGEGRMFLQLEADITHPAIAVPGPLRDHVELISWWSQIPSIPHRIIGVYRTDDAEAQLDFYKNDRNRRRLVINGRDIASMYRLYSEIRSGKALPTESWEDELPLSQPAAHSQLLPPPGE